VLALLLALFPSIEVSSFRGAQVPPVSSYIRNWGNLEFTYTKKPLTSPKKHRNLEFTYTKKPLTSSKKHIHTQT
jgi:hypothetical protein